MLFGLALLAGLVGYVAVDPFGSDEDNSDEAAKDELNAAQAEAANGTGIEDLLGEGSGTDTADATETADAAASTDTTGTDTAATDTDTATDEGAVETPDVTSADDIVEGTDTADLIYGGDGDYTINGGGGDDQLHGGDGNTILNGGAGDDTLFAGDGYVGQSDNILNGGAGADTIYGSNEAENLLNGDDGDDEIHMRGSDTATGGEGADGFHYSTEYSDGEVSTITDYNADEDQIVVEHAVGFVSGAELIQPEVSITIEGADAIICLDGEECVVVQGAANSLAVGDILLQATPTF